MTISAAEAWLVEQLQCVFGEAFKSIESGPGEWSDAYLARVVGQAPAIRVAFLDAAARDKGSLTLDSRWAVYVLTGWSGGDQRTRRRGAGDRIGAYRAVEVIAPWLHRMVIPDVGRCQVAAVTNLWTGELDKKGLALFAIGLAVTIDLDPDPETCDSELQDFLKAGVDWDLPGGGEVDHADTFDIPQEDP